MPEPERPPARDSAEPERTDARVDAGPERTGARGARATPSCKKCGGNTRFAGGEQIHDLWAERFVCEGCRDVSYRSYGRGSV
jgi:hypothetical protein